MESESSREPLVDRVRDVAEQDTDADEPGLELRDRPKPSRAQQQRGGAEGNEAAQGDET
jgi:hypothetical protein